MNTCINCKYFPHTEHTTYNSEVNYGSIFGGGPAYNEVVYRTQNPLHLKCQHPALACRITGEFYIKTEEARSPVIGGCGYEGRLFEQITPEESEARRQAILAQREKAIADADEINKWREQHRKEEAEKKLAEEKAEAEIAAAAAKQKARILANDPSDEVHSTTHSADLASRKSWWQSLFQ
jgi:hypothetical protein